MRPVGTAGGIVFFFSFFVGDWKLRFSPKVRHQHEVGDDDDGLMFFFGAGRIICL